MITHSVKKTDPTYAERAVGEYTNSDRIVYPDRGHDVEAAQGAGEQGEQSMLDDGANLKTSFGNEKG